MHSRLELGAKRFAFMLDEQRDRLLEDPIIGRERNGQSGADRLAGAREWFTHLPADSAMHIRSDWPTEFIEWWTTTPDWEYTYVFASVLLNEGRDRRTEAEVHDGELYLRPGELIYCAGDLHVRGSVRTEDSSALIVAGELRVDGVLLSRCGWEPPLVIAESFIVADGATFGGVVVPGQMTCPGRFYFADEQYYHSTVRSYRGGVVVDFEQKVVYSECIAEVAVHKPKLKRAARALLGDEASADDLGSFFEVLAEERHLPPWPNLN